MNAKLFTDGGSRNNPGPAAIGGILYDSRGVELDRFSQYIGVATNNQAEYQALAQGLVLAQKHKLKQLDVYLDSELVVKQIQGEYKVKEAGLRQRVAELQSVLQAFTALHLHHIPRAENALADSLVNQALDEQLES